MTKKIYKLAFFLVIVNILFAPIIFATENVLILSEQKKENSIKELFLGVKLWFTEDNRYPVIYVIK